MTTSPGTLMTTGDKATSGQPPSTTGSKSVATVSRKTRENKQDKGTRLLTQGRLTVTKVDGDVVRAECKGDSGEVYELGFANGHWTCSCPAMRDCSHLSALWRVTVRPERHGRSS